MTSIHNRWPFEGLGNQGFAGTAPLVARSPAYPDAWSAHGYDAWSHAAQAASAAAARNLAQRLSVQVGPPPQGPAVVTAHAAFALYKQRTHGEVTRYYGFPSTRAAQTTDLGTLKLDVFDAYGRKVPGAVRAFRVAPAGPTMPERSELAVTFDLARLPSPAYFKFSVDVRVGDDAVDLETPIPLAELRQVPDEAKRFLVAGKEIQADHPEIQAAAARIREGAATLQDLVGATLAAMDKVRKPADLADPMASLKYGLDALAYLRHGVGSCTSNANLFAALMRANGVPTRVTNEVSHGLGQDMHFVNEYWAPGRGWVHVEPQARAIQTPRWYGVDTGVAYAEQEQGRAQYWTGIWGEERGPKGEPLPSGEGAIVSTRALLVPNDHWSPEAPKGFAVGRGL